MNKNTITQGQRGFVSSFPLPQPMNTNTLSIGQTVFCNTTGRQIIIDGIRSRDGAIWEQVTGNHESERGTARFFGTNYSTTIQHSPSLPKS